MIIYKDWFIVYNIRRNIKMNRQEEMLCMYTLNKQTILNDYDNKFNLLSLCEYTVMTSLRDN